MTQNANIKVAEMTTVITSHNFINNTFKIKEQERRLKRPNTLGGLEISLVEKKTVAMWNSLVTSKLVQYLYNVWKPNCQVCHLWLFCWYCSFVMCIRTKIHGLVAFPVLLPIDIENPHHYWNVVYR